MLALKFARYLTGSMLFRGQRACTGEREPNHDDQEPFGLSRYSRRLATATLALPDEGFDPKKNKRSGDEKGHKHSAR
jgi:hypothetical protein